MSQWKNDDSAANSVLWGVAQYNKTANAANRNAFFGNTTANAYVEGITVGQYGVDTSEIAATRQAAEARPAHAGWVNRIEGQGNRANRIQHEVLVAMGSMSADAEDNAFPDYTIVISSQPPNRTVNASSTSNTTTFAVTAASVPSGATLAYRWEANTGSGFANAGSGTTGNTTATLTVQANQFSTGVQFRVVISTTGADTKTSNAGVLTITT